MWVLATTPGQLQPLGAYGGRRRLGQNVSYNILEWNGVVSLPAGQARFGYETS